MERLTTTNKDLNREMICRNEDCGVTEEHCPHLMEDECACLREVINKLADYEDAEEQGLLLRLPCKVGDTVFIPMKPYILEYNITSFEISRYGSWLMNLEHEEERRRFRTVELGESFGKTWFLTREEAESALAEKGGA